MRFWRRVRDEECAGTAGVLCCSQSQLPELDILALLHVGFTFLGTKV